jgi:Uma2 family endonuclease
MPVAAAARLTPEQFLAWEQAQVEKHEFLAGNVFAMVGATRRHVTVAGNVFALLKTHLAGSRCRVYMADMKLRIEASDAFFYPDVFVTCDERDHRADTFMSSATLIVEVLSESTSGFDRGEKFAAYRRLPTLREYVLVDPDRQRLECFRRGPDGHWVLFEFPTEGTVRLESVEFEVGLADMFAQAD